MKKMSTPGVWLLALPVLLAACATQNGAVAPPAATKAAPTAVAAHAAKAEHPLPAPSALETQYGLQIVQVGLTASGGLVDLRFKVLDVAKARALLGNPANAPMLIAGDKPPLAPPHHALRGARFGQGQVVFILYPNLRGAIQPGTEVVVAMGNARLGPVLAQ
jgi:hypothetical protein